MDAHLDFQCFITKMQLNVTRVGLKLLWVQLMTEIQMKPLQQWKAAINWIFPKLHSSVVPEVCFLD